MIPRSWVDHSLASPGRILILRDKVEQQYHGIWTPSGIQQHTRKALGTVVDVSPECSGYGVKKGDRVLLGPSAGRPIVYGYAFHVETELWSIPPHAILARIDETVEAEWRQPSPAEAAADWQASRGPADDKRFDEGDRRGLR